MLFKQKSTLLLVFAATVSTWLSCTKTDLSTIGGIELSPTLAVPLVKATFAFQDFIKSDSLLKTGADGTIQIVYAQDNIASYSVTDIVNQATGNVGATIGKNIVMGDLNVAGFSTQKSTTLSAFSSSFSDPTKTLFATGGTTPSTGIPAFTQTTNAQTDMDDLTEFQSITLASGQLQLTVKNNFPFALQNVKVDLLDRGKAYGLITTLNLGNIAANSTVNTTADLTGKTFSNKLAYRVPSLSSNGIPGFTTISSAATLIVTATGSNMKLKTGVVKLLAQDLLPENIVAPITTGNVDQKLKEITIKSASSTYTISKTIPANFLLELTFPTIKENGVAVTRTINVNSNSVTGTINFNNAVVDLASIAAQPYNQLPIIAKASMSASTGFVTINAADAITINTSFNNVKIDGAKGQFGVFNVNIPTKTLDFAYDFSFLNKASQKLIFDNPQVRLKYTNSFGIPITSNLNVMADGFLGTSEALGIPAFDITYPRMAQLGQSIKDTFAITKTNSRIVPFLSILPNKMTYSGAVQMHSNNASETNFFMADSKINLGAEFILPLKFSTENLIVRDTIAGNLATENADKFESASLIINHTNGFPLKTSMDLVAIKAGVSTTVISNFSIPSATVGSDGRVSQANIGNQILSLDKTQLKNVLEAEKLIIVGRLQTANSGLAPVSLLSTYTFDISVGMKAQLKIKQ
jgi:hypothetical protein